VDNPLSGVSAKQKKVLVVVGVGAAAFVAWKWMSSGNSADTAATPTTSGTDADQAATGIIGSNVGGSENTGNSSNTGTSAITSNDQWYQAAEDRLVNAGWNAQAVQSALGEFLMGHALDPSEVKIVQAAVGAMGGYPPNGPSTIKQTVGTTDVSKLKAPTGVKGVSNSPTTVDLTWSAVSGAKQYRVYRSGASQNVGGSIDTKAQVAGLQPGTKYTFYVAAGLDGEKMGPRSTGVTVTTQKRKLTAPTGLKISNVTKNSARLTWNPTYPGEYLIRRSGSSSTSESVDPATTLSGLHANTKYHFQVAAVEPGTRTPGPWSSYVTFTTKR
jgi:hypothetical protein